jgi:hypothetical protein
MGGTSEPPAASYLPPIVLVVVVVLVLGRFPVVRAQLRPLATSPIVLARFPVGSSEPPASCLSFFLQRLF